MQKIEQKHPSLRNQLTLISSNIGRKKMVNVSMKSSRLELYSGAEEIKGRVQYIMFNQMLQNTWCFQSPISEICYRCTKQDNLTTERHEYCSWCPMFCRWMEVWANYFVVIVEFDPQFPLPRKTVSGSIYFYNHINKHDNKKKHGFHGQEFRLQLSKALIISECIGGIHVEEITFVIARNLLKLIW